MLMILIIQKLKFSVQCSCIIQSIRCASQNRRALKEFNQMPYYKLQRSLFASAIALAAPACFATSVQADPIDVATADNWRQSNLLTFTANGQWVAKLSAPSQSLQEFIEMDAERAKATYPDVAKNFDRQFVLTITNNSGKSYTVSSHAAFESAQFSKDGNWFGVLKQQKPGDDDQESDGEEQIQKRDFVLVDLRNGKQQEFPNISQAEFAGKHAFLRRGPDNPALFAKSLVSSRITQMGPATELTVNNQRTHIAWTISSDEGFGNGLFVSPANSISVTTLDQNRAQYSTIAWSRNGNSLTALKTDINASEKDEEAKTSSVVFAALGVTSKQPRTFEIGSSSNGFPKNFEIATSGGEDEYGYSLGDLTAASWSEDGKALLLQLTKSKTTDTEDNQEDEDSEDRIVPDLAFWHWKQNELPSQESQDEQWEEDRTYSAIYWVENSKLVPLQTDKDSEDFSIQGFEIDNINSNYDFVLGVQADDPLTRRLKQNFSTKPGNVILINTKTGERKSVLKDIDRVYGTFSPNGQYFAFWEDGHFSVYDISSNRVINITENLPVSFINDDLSNIERTPVSSPRWTEENGLVLEDNWNLWHVQDFFAESGPVQKRLTNDGLEKRIDYSVVPFKTHLDLNDYEPNAYLDQDREPLENNFLAFAFEKRTMRAGYVRVSLNDQNVTWFKPLGDKAIPGDATLDTLIEVIKTESGERFIFSEQDFDEKKISLLDPLSGDTKTLLSLSWDTEPSRRNVGKSAGLKTINYSCNWDGAPKEVAEKEGTLVLPANYKKGRKYPTIVTVYEDRGNIGVAYGAYRYATPYLAPDDLITLTSHGYAVYLPDVAHIATKPGSSGLQCLMPALDAVLETGIVDEDNIGLHGHSWGGYQTLFYTTQTNRFKAAISGAGLSNLISMYGTVYWGGGGLVQNVLLEVGQGRMKNTLWENWESWVENSPLYHVENVKTPLLIMHNDGDPAVPFSQGMGHFLALQRLQKPVALLQYRGEGHGLYDRYNQIDYFQRGLEFWDYHLKGKEAPKWWSEGIKPSDIDDHLDERFEDVLAEDEE